MIKRCKVDSWQTHEDWDWVNASALLSMKSVPKKGHRRDIRGDPLSYIFFAADCNIKNGKVVQPALPSALQCVAARVAQC